MKSERRGEEYRLEAELLERFTHFVDWPRGDPGRDADRPFVLCVIGANPFGEALSDLAARRSCSPPPMAPGC